MEQQVQSKEILELRKDVNSLKELVGNLTILLNKELIKELYIEAENINNGEFLTEEQFVKKNKIKTLHNL